MAKQFKVAIGPTADTERDAILVYHRNKYGSENASRLYIKLLSLLEELELRPLSKPIVFIPNRAFKYQYRFALVSGTYKIVYRVIPNRGLVYVISVRHKKKDSSSLIQLIEQE